MTAVRTEGDPANVPFNRPTLTGAEEGYLAAAMRRGKFAAGGPFAERCSAWLRESFGTASALPTKSCSHALEMAALLCDLGPADEVILPSFAFPTAAGAFARTGAKLVFVDIEPSTMNIDPAAAAAAVTERTRVIVALHYAGVACDMERLAALARRHQLVLIEDAAQAILSEHRGELCGTLGTFGCFSFHETKNLQCGEGGALLINEQRYVDRAEVIWQKGTDRSRLLRGEVKKYRWQDLGSSYALGELSSAFLLAQLEHAREVTADRLRSWHSYLDHLQPLADRGLIEVPKIPPFCQHNGHIFWIKTLGASEQVELIQFLRRRSIQSVFHFVPLHSAPAGRRFGRFAGQDRHTTDAASRLIRLPLFHRFDAVERVVDAIMELYT